MKDLISGERKFIKSPDAKHLQIPQYETLSVQKLYEFMHAYQETWPYFPEPVEMKKLPKQWIANVGYSILGDTFAGWVKQQIEQRNDKLQVKGSLHIAIDPEVAAAFEASTAVSCKYHLLFFTSLIVILLPFFL